MPRRRRQSTLDTRMPHAFAERTQAVRDLAGAIRSSAATWDARSAILRLWAPGACPRGWLTRSRRAVGVRPFRRIRHRRPSNALRSAADAGRFDLAYDQLSGKHVCTTAREFTDADPAVTATYLDAFMRLCERGLVVHQHEELFRLSGQGFRIARRLRNGKSGP